MLTAAGDALGRRASAALREIDAGLGEVRAASANAKRVSASPHLASRFLVGQIERFTKRHPGTQIELGVKSRHVDFERELVDIAVRFGPRAWAGLRAEMLFRPRVVAVCAVGVGPRRTIGEVRQHLSFSGAEIGCCIIARDSNRRWMKVHRQISQPRYSLIGVHYRPRP